MRTILILAGVAIGAYVAAMFGLWAFQRRLVYINGGAPYHAPEDTGLSDLREVRLDTPDGERLVAWWRPAAAGKPTLLYFQGNAGALMNRLPRIERFSAGGYGVFMPAYRGYSGSTGRPSEDALVADAMLAYDYLREAGLGEGDIVLYGESLGSGVAVRLAGLRPVAGVVLDAPFTSLPDVARRAYPFAPVDTFMTERFESKRHIGRVRAPILMMHGDEDRTIPIGIGRELYEEAPEPKRFAVIAGASHSNIYEYGAFESLRDFLDGLTGGRQQIRGAAGD